VKTFKNQEMRELVKNATPVTCESLFNTLMHAVDARMVAILGISRIAAVSFTNTPMQLVYALFYAFNSATTILVPEHLGKNDRDGAMSTVKAGFVITLAASMTIGLLCFVFSSQIMSLFAKDPEILKEAADYFGITMLCCVFRLLGLYMNACNVANENANSVFYSNVLANIINILFDYLLIDGHLGFPAYGIKGAAYATVIGNFCGMMVSAHSLFVSNKGFSLKALWHTGLELREKLSQYSILWRDLCTTTLSERAGLFAVSIINAKAGVISYSIYTIGNYFLNINFAVGRGLSVASLSLISRNRDDRDAVQRYAASLKKLLLFAVVLLAVIYPLCSTGIYGFYSKEPDFIRQGFYSSFLISLITPFHIASLTYAGFLNSMRDTGYVSKISILSILIVNCIASYIFIVVMGWGIYGIWTSCLFAYITSAGAYYIRYARKYGAKK